MWSPFLALILLTAKSLGQSFPKCWKHYGECLDDNEPPLNTIDKVKPLNNKNVIQSFPHINNVEDCSSKCEEFPECNYFTVYKSDPNKDCQLVGFNLGNSCKRLANVCVIHKACGDFNSSCGMGCVTGRRFIQDKSADYKTLVIGGVKDKRLKADEYETSIEVLDNTGKSECDKSEKTEKREGAAGAYLSSGDVAVLCGGWQTTSVAMSSSRSGYIKGEYLNSCECIKKTADDRDLSTVKLVKHRAFFSMAATDNSIFAFGGYNNYQGMLEYIEKFDGTSWSEVTTKLAEPKSHTCAASVKFHGKDLIFVFGGWNQNLDFVSVVEVFEVNPDGDLVLNMTHDLPADRADDESRSMGKSDMGCMHYRRAGWEDGILMTGGYREAGAWLNTAWWLNLTLLFDGKPAWERITNISPDFDKGRHFHQMTTANHRPLIVGGWKNKAEDTSLMLDECEEDDDPSRPGIWEESSARKLKIGREKFAAISVPKDFLKDTDLFCT